MHTETFQGEQRIMMSSYVQNDAIRPGVQHPHVLTRDCIYVTETEMGPTTNFIFQHGLFLVANTGKHYLINTLREGWKSCLRRYCKQYTDVLIIA